MTGANLTLGSSLNVVITDGGHSGAATTTVQGTTSISSTGLRLDGGRTFRNEGTVTQTGNVDLNSRRTGVAEAGNGTVVNAATGTWNTGAAGTNFVFATNQGAGDTGAGSIFTNAGTFNKVNAGTTDFRSALVNDGTLNVQAGQLQFGSGGSLNHSGVLTIAAGAVLDFASAAAVTSTDQHRHHHGGRHALDHERQRAELHHRAHDRWHRHLPAQLRPGDRREPHTRADAERRHHRRWPQRRRDDDGCRAPPASAAPACALDGGRTFRNEGTVAQVGNVDLNSRRSGAAQAGNGTVFNAAGGTWNARRGGQQLHPHEQPGRG